MIHGFLFSVLISESLTPVSSILNSRSGCMCDKDQYCLEGSCRSCPLNSISIPGSEKIEDCLCNPGYSWEMANKGTKGFICAECIAGTYKPQRGNRKCQMCPAFSVSPMGSSHEDNCTQASESTSLAMSFKERVMAARSTPRKALKQKWNKKRISTAECCPGLISTPSFLTGWGLGIEITGSETANSMLPFGHIFSLFRVSANGEFGIGLVACVTVNGDQCSASIHRINLTTFEDTLIAGNRAVRVSDMPNHKGIDGSGPNSTFVNSGTGDIAIAADGSHALIADLGWIRRIELDTYSVRTICGKFGSVMGFDMSADGSFVLVRSFFGGVKKLDPFTCKMMGIHKVIESQDKLVRISSDSESAIYFNANECTIEKVSLESKRGDITVLAGGSCIGIRDGIGQSAGLGELEGLALFPTGNQALFIDRGRGNWFKPGPRYIRSLDLNTLAVTTLSIVNNVSALSWTSSSLDCLVRWRPCPAGSFSLARATSCQPCPRGTFQDEAGSSSCKPCALGPLKSLSSAAECLPPLAPGKGPCELPNLTWPYISTLAGGAWTGALETHKMQEVQVWACLSQTQLPDLCRASAISLWKVSAAAAACYAYNERTGQFAYWGANRDLGLLRT